MKVWENFGKILGKFWELEITTAILTLSSELTCGSTPSADEKEVFACEMLANT
jgi:hypothetical protein